MPAWSVTFELTDRLADKTEHPGLCGSLGKIQRAQLELIQLRAALRGPPTSIRFRGVGLARLGHKVDSPLHLIRVHPSTKVRNGLCALVDRAEMFDGDWQHSREMPAVDA